MPRRIDTVIYGGSFDPPHSGHLDCVRLALAAFPEASVLIVPGYQAAGAHGQHKTAEASHEHRLTMCGLCFAGLERVEISRLEAELPAPNYTVDTLRQMRARGAEHLGLLMGTDQLASFHGWREPAAILDMASLIVVERPGSGGEAGPTGAQAVDEALKKVPQAEGRLQLIGSSIWPAASSEIKERYRQGLSVPSGWLPESVDSYIRTHGLYGT